MVVVRRVVSERTFSVMAQGGDVLETTMHMLSRHYEDIKVPTPLNKFLEGSTWLSIIRFFGHALQREHLLYCYCSLHLYSGYSYIADHDACRHLSMLIHVQVITMILSSFAVLPTRMTEIGSFMKVTVTW